MAKTAIRLRLGDVRFLEPQDDSVSPRDFVVFETERGLDCSPAILVAEHLVGQYSHGAKAKLLRKATSADLAQMETKWREERQAHVVCAEKVSKHGLEMQLVQTVYTFDFARLTFYYTADGRVDFRQLLKDLTSTFRRTRIDLRQIGVRDEVKLLGGVGACGKELCCASFLREFMPITIKLAKDQQLSLNPAKLSGICGRLKCCLAYEHEMVVAIKAELPVLGSAVRTPEGLARVVGHDLFNDALRVELDQKDRVMRLDSQQVLPVDPD